MHIMYSTGTSQRMINRFHYELIPPDQKVYLTRVNCQSLRCLLSKTENVCQGSAKKDLTHRSGNFAGAESSDSEELFSLCLA